MSLAAAVHNTVHELYSLIPRPPPFFGFVQYNTWKRFRFRALLLPCNILNETEEQKTGGGLGTRLQTVDQI